ncbi:MAG: DUF6378 domain-containing protein [Planctomycetota bacterium]
MKPTYYLAGPMRGYDRFNFDAFEQAAKELRYHGYQVLSPAEADLEMGFDPDDENALDGFSLDDAIIRDLEMILTAEAIVCLPGHRKSRGATAERAIAAWRGIPMLSYPKLTPLPGLVEELAEFDALWESIGDHRYEPVDNVQDLDVLEEALKITQGDRQAQYGPPDQDFRRTAEMWNGLFSDGLKEGWRFEPVHVALAMVCLKASREMHQRKRDNFVDMAGYARCGQICRDAETASTGT